MLNLYITYFFVILTLGISIFLFILRYKFLATKDRRVYFYLLISVTGWVITNAIADLSSDYGIALWSARLAIIFPLNFMSGFLSLARQFPQSMKEKKGDFIVLVNIGTFIITTIFLIFLASPGNISDFRVSAFGPAEYTPGTLYTISLIYACILLIAIFGIWIRNWKNYTRTQRIQISILIGSLMTVFAALGLGLTYFPAVGLIEYGPTAFLSLSLLLFITNQIFFVKSFLTNIAEDIVRIVTFICLGVVNSLVVLYLITFIEHLNPLSLLLINIVLVSGLFLVGNYFIKSTQADYERLKKQALEFSGKISSLLERDAILKSLIETLQSMFPKKKIILVLAENKNSYPYMWWSKQKIIKPLTPEIIIEESLNLKKIDKWKKLFLREIVKEEIILLLPIYSNKGISGWVKVSGSNLSLKAKEYEILDLLSQNLSIGFSRSQLYSEIVMLNKSLERKVNQQSREILEKYNQLVEIQKRERDMIDIMGHELRTPISIIKIQFTLLVKRLKSLKGYEGVVSYIENINSAISRESRLIDSLLGATKIDQERLELNFSNESLVEIVKESYMAHLRELNKKGLKFSFDSPKDANSWRIDTDRVRLLEVLDNLISNAIKYTHEGEIKVSVEKLRENYLINVSDTGIGLAKEDIDKLGEKFYRVKADKDKKIIRPGGTGLGLYVSKGIVKKHGGEIKVESKVNKGSTFKVKLPIKQNSIKKAPKKQVNLFERFAWKKDSR